MPKIWLYNINDKVQINENAKSGMRDCVYECGYISELLETPLYDYMVKFFKGGEGKFKEKELNLLSPTKIKNTGEEGYIIMIDKENKQAEVTFKDRSSKVYNYESLMFVDEEVI